MIRLLSVIGHGTKLIPHFIEHYSKHVDEIQFVVYQTDMYPTLATDVKEIISKYSKVKVVKTVNERIFDWEKVTQLYNFIKNSKPNDWWVIADIDEFHLYPHDKLEYTINSCDEYGYQLVRGGFVDRVGENGSFPEIKDDVHLFEQFPMMGFFRYPMSKACPNKICVMKGNIELTSGQHYAKINGETTWRWQGWNHPLINPHNTVQVHHFKWDSTAGERIKAVADIKKPYAYSEEYELMYSQLRKNKFKIDLNNPEYMFENGGELVKYSSYRKWDRLIKKIMSI